MADIESEIRSVNSVGNPVMVRSDKGGNLERGPVGNVLPTGIMATGEEADASVKGEGYSLDKYKMMLKGKSMMGSKRAMY